jgi:hypothetical protein
MKKNNVSVRNRISNFPSPEELTISLSKKKTINFCNGCEKIEAIITYLKKENDFLWNITVKILSNSREFSHLEPGGFFFGNYDSKKKEGVLFSTVP